MKQKSTGFRTLTAVLLCMVASAAVVNVAGCGDDKDDKKSKDQKAKKKKKSRKAKGRSDVPSGFGQFAQKKPGKPGFGGENDRTPVGLLRTYDLPADEGDGGRVFAAVVACDARHVLYATRKKVHVMNVVSGKELAGFDCPKGTPLALSPGGAHAIVLTEQKADDGPATEYKTSTVELSGGKIVRSQLGHWGRAFFANKGMTTFLVGRGTDDEVDGGTLLLCQRETKSTEEAEPETLPFENVRPGWTAAMTPDGKSLALRTGRDVWVKTIGSKGKPRETATLGSLRAAGMPAIEGGQAPPAELVALAPDGRRLVTAGEETIRVLEVNSGFEVWRYGELRKLPPRVPAPAAPLGHPQSGWVATSPAGQMDVLAVAPDGTFAVTAHRDGKLRVWGLPGQKDWPRKKAKKTARILRESATIVGAHAVALSPDGRNMAIATADGPRVEGLRSVTAKAAMAARTGGVWSATAADMGTALPKPEVRKRGAPAPPETPTVVVTQMQFFSDGKYVATNGRKESLAGADGLRIWQTATKKLYGHGDLKGPIDALAVSPDARIIALGASTGEGVRLWAGLGDESAHAILPAGKNVTALAFSPDGKWLATSGGGADGGSVTALWSMETRKRAASLDGHTAAVRQIVFSPDGKLLATAGADKAVRLWSAPDGKCLATLEGHKLPVTSVSFSPDGKRLASAAGTHQDRPELKIWDVKRKKQLAEAQGHRLGIRQVLFSPDGQWLLTAGCDATVKLWQLTKPAAVERPKLTLLKDEDMKIWKDPDPRDAAKMLRTAMSLLKSPAEPRRQEGIAKLREIVARQHGTPAAKEAAKLLEKGPETTAPATTKPAVSRIDQRNAQRMLLAALKTAKSGKKTAKEDAVKQLRELVAKYPGTEAAKKADEHIQELAPPPAPKDDRKVKAELADKMLRMAKLQLSNNLKNKAIAKLQQVVKEYPSTPAAVQAAAILKRLLKTPQSQPAGAKQPAKVDEEANRKLGMAKMLLTNQATAAAVKKLREIIEKHPNTTAAEAAATLIEKTNASKDKPKPSDT